jgi:hypothetical protein
MKGATMNTITAIDKDIEVWRPRITIPSGMSAAISAIDDIGDTRETDNVGFKKIGNLEALVSDGLCGWHDDKHIGCRYTLLLVVRNDTDSYVESIGKYPPVFRQSAGTMIFLNIYREHRLWHKKGKDAPSGVWAAFYLNLKKVPESRKQCERMMREHIGTYF